MLYENIISKLQRLEQEIKSIETNLNSLPTGKLICAKCGKYTKWYQSDGHHSTYLPKKEKALAQQLAYKKYLSLKLKEIKQEKSALAFYLRHHSKESPSHLLLTREPGYSELLMSYFTPSSDELTNWMSEPYEKNPFHPELCIHKTSNGDFVRSKSEAMIAMLLHTNQIPFRYEASLSLDETILYPDFTIRHPITGKYYYWEHFGMMDSKEYAHNTFSKLNLYTINGILPSIHLITTYETKDHPINYEMVENLIQFYFLQ